MLWDGQFWLRCKKSGPCGPNFLDSGGQLATFRNKRSIWMVQGECSIEVPRVNSGDQLVHCFIWSLSCHGFLPPTIIRFSRDRVHAVLGAAHWASAKLSRSLLKSFFEKGDQPQAQFATLIDSMANLIEDRDLLACATSC